MADSARLRPIVAIVALAAAFRALLAGRGAMAFLDETMYYKAGLAVSELAHGRVAAALAHIGSNNGRPGNALMQLVPATLQAIPFAFGVPTSNPRSLLIPQACNIAVTLIALWLFARISLRLFGGDGAAAAVATAVYALLVNSNIYARHLLAYEPALCLGLAALWIALSRPPTLPLAAGVGSLAAFAVTVYPGYYLFAMIPAVVLACDWKAPSLAIRAGRAAAFAAGGAATITLMEGVGRIGGVSYIASARALSGTITQGSFDEGWSFLPRYLVEVEGYAGVALLVGVAAWVAVSAREFARGEPLRSIHWLVAAALAGWIVQAVGSSFAHQMVLYGRLIHPWMPFAVWATIDAIRAAMHRTVRTALQGAMLAASLASFAAFAPPYLRMAYPADTLYALGIDTRVLPHYARRCALGGGYNYDSPAPLNRQTNAPYAAHPNVVLVNFCQGAPPPAAELEPTDAARDPIFRARHFMAFRAYAFEGLAPAERDAMATARYDLRVLPVR